MHDCYYMHYLCIVGDIIRMRNFILYLRENGKDPVKVCNYNLLPEFNHDTCLHTAAQWNSEPGIFVMLRDECEGDLRIPNGNGFCPSESDYIPMSIYKNPFINIIGDGALVFDHFNPRRREERDFREIISYLEGVEQELDALDDEHGPLRGQEEEIEEEVILRHNNINDMIYHDAVEPPLVRQNGVGYDDAHEDYNLRNVRRKLF